MFVLCYDVIVHVEGPVVVVLSMACPHLSLRGKEIHNLLSLGFTHIRTDNTRTQEGSTILP